MKKSIIITLVLCFSVFSVVVLISSEVGDPVAPPVVEVDVPVAPTPNVVVLPPLVIEEEAGFEDDRVPRIRGLEHGEVVARLTVPRLDMLRYPIRFGIGLDILAVGPALYPGSAAPGEGNFAMAGHRITPVGPWDHGPFRYVDTLQRGDIAKVLYKGDTYVYHFVRNIIIDPSNTNVLSDGRSDMTFTACHPPGFSTERIVSQWKLA